MFWTLQALSPHMQTLCTSIGNPIMNFLSSSRNRHSSSIYTVLTTSLTFQTETNRPRARRHTATRKEQTVPVCTWGGRRSSCGELHAGLGLYSLCIPITFVFHPLCRRTTFVFVAAAARDRPSLLERGTCATLHFCVAGIATSGNYTHFLSILLYCRPLLQ